MGSGDISQSQIKPLDEAIRRQTIDRFQAEIDAMNRYYAEKDRRWSLHVSRRQVVVDVDIEPLSPLVGDAQR